MSEQCVRNPWHGIIMTSWSVRGMLAGEKTQIRPLIVPQPILVDGRTWEWPCETLKPDVGPPTQISKASWGLDIPPSDCMTRFCRYKVGDLLYVKEAWRVNGWNENDGLISVQYRADNSCGEWVECDDEELYERLWIESIDDAMASDLVVDTDGQYHWKDGNAPTRWRSPLFMPHWAARPELRPVVTQIRAERVQEISMEDCMAEGWPKHQELYPDINREDKTKLWFQRKWNSLHRKPKPVRANSRWAKWLGWQKDSKDAWDWDRRNILGHVSLPWSEETRDPRETIRGKPHACFPNPWVWPVSFKGV